MTKALKDKYNNSLNVILEIRNINNELEKAYEYFQNQTDSDLVDAGIYRIKELRARHSYLIKYAKENNIAAEYMNFSESEKKLNA